MTATCETCRFWEEWVIVPRLNSGCCRIRATTGRHEHTEKGYTYVSAFPFISRVGWCGEHKEKDQ